METWVLKSAKIWVVMLQSFGNLAERNSVDPKLAYPFTLKLPIQGQLLEKLLIQLSYTQFNHWFQKDYFRDTSQKKMWWKWEKVNCLMRVFFSSLKIFRKYQLTFPEFPSTFTEAASEADVPQRTKYIEYSLKTLTFMFQQSFRDWV